MSRTIILSLLLSVSLFADKTSTVNSNSVNVTNNSSAQFKVALVDMDKIHSSSKSIRRVMKKLERLNNDYSNQWKDQDEKLQNEANAINKRKLNAKTDDAKKLVKDAEAKLAQKRQDFQKEIELKSEEFNTLNNNAMEKLRQKVISESKKIADKHRNMIVLPSMLVLAHADTGSVVNITEEVIEAVNKDEE